MRPSRIFAKPPRFVLHGRELPRPYTRRFCNYLVLSPTNGRRDYEKKKRVPRFRVSLEAPLRTRIDTGNTGTQSIRLHFMQPTPCVAASPDPMLKISGFQVSREMCKRTFVGRDIRKGFAPKPRSFLFALPPPSSIGFHAMDASLRKNGRIVSYFTRCGGKEFKIYDFRFAIAFEDLP